LQVRQYAGAGAHLLQRVNQHCEPLWVQLARREDALVAGRPR
jgi:hypothetical protein